MALLPPKIPPTATRNEWNEMIDYVTGSQIKTGNLTIASGSSITIQNGGIRATVFFGAPSSTLAVVRGISGVITSISGSGGTVTLNRDINNRLSSVVYNIGGLNYTGSINRDSGNRFLSITYSS